MSNPYALPVGPTLLAESKTSIPPPDPKSSTTSPGFNFAKAVGLPQPSEACNASPGICSLCAASYRLEVIGSQLVPLASAVPQQLPLFPRSAACPYFSLKISFMFAPSMPPSECLSIFQSRISTLDFPVRTTRRLPRYPAALALCSACSTRNRGTATGPGALPYLPCTAKTCSHAG